MDQQPSASRLGRCLWGGLEFRLVGAWCGLNVRPKVEDGSGIVSPCVIHAVFRYTLCCVQKDLFQQSSGCFTKISGGKSGKCVVR